MKKKEIYVSYSWDDKGNIERVENLVKSLNDTLKSDYSIIFDQELFNNETQDINRFMIDNIIDSDMVVVFVTPSYVEKANKKDNGYGNKNNKKSGVEIETQYILERKHFAWKSIVTVLLDGEELPKYLRQLSYINEKKDVDIIKKIEKKIRNFINERHVVCKDARSEKAEVLDNLNTENVDIEFSYTDEPARISGILLLGNSYINLEHYQIVNIFKKIVSENIISDLMEKSSYYFYCSYFRVEFKNYYLYENFITKIKNAMDKYLDSVLKFEAKYEIYSRIPINSDYKFKLATVNKNIWVQMLEFANSFDWGKGESKWNIFQHNDYYIHVFSPVISCNDRYDACEHLILYAVNRSDFYSNDVNVYIKINDMIYNSKRNKIDVRKTWSIDMAYRWLKEDFIPFFCKVNNYSEDVIQLEDTKYHEEDIFSRAQEFYMCNKAEVKNEELNQLKEILIFCLNKKPVGRDLAYIKSKLEIGEKLTTNDEIVQYLNSNKFNKYLIESSYNASIADNMLRCIKSFTDDYSTHRINEQDIKYLSKRICSLTSKMEKINLLDKYNK